MNSVCAKCGVAYFRDQKGSQCPDCKPSRSADINALRSAKGQTDQGYDATWRRLSKRARKMQPFCSDCGSEHDLTGDHTSEAWKRKAAGKVIRLKDIDVVCRRCNSERGAARGEKATDRWR